MARPRDIFGSTQSIPADEAFGYWLSVIEADMESIDINPKEMIDAVHADFGRLPEASRTKAFYKWINSSVAALCAEFDPASIVSTSLKMILTLPAQHRAHAYDQWLENPIIATAAKGPAAKSIINSPMSIIPSLPYDQGLHVYLGFLNKPVIVGCASKDPSRIVKAVYDTIRALPKDQRDNARESFQRSPIGIYARHRPSSGYDTYFGKDRDLSKRQDSPSLSLAFVMEWPGGHLHPYRTGDVPASSVPQPLPVLAAA